MKINAKSLLVIPKARYFVERNGNVKSVGFVDNRYSMLNISKQQKRYVLMNQILQLGLGKQYE